MAELLAYSYQTAPPASPLRTFAYLGGSLFTGKLEYLKSIAEQENWYYDAPNAHSERQKRVGVLFQYIHNTFSRALDEGKVLETEECAIFNTGLFTVNGEEIFAYFTPNTASTAPPQARQKWYLRSFYKESARELPTSVRSSLPPYVDYFRDNPHDMYFDPSLRIFVNADHIIDENFDRFPESVKSLPIAMIKLLLTSAESIMKRKISRNNRLVVPQYYNKKIMYLAPLQILTDIIPLAIERDADTYRVNTIFTHGMAYCNARLLMKPESNWLVNA